MSKTLEQNCPLCFETLTIKNAVNPSCGHTHCSTCFWKWARKSNACPFCRKDLIGRERQKELELANLLERRTEIREHLEEMYNEGHAREIDLRSLQEDIALEELHLKGVKEIIKENFEILKKVEKWEARINLWECCPDKAIELWKVEAKEMKKNWRVTQLKKLRVCLDELDTTVRLKVAPRYHELTIEQQEDEAVQRQMYRQAMALIQSRIPCIQLLMNRVPHLVRAEKIQRVEPEPIKEDFNLDALFLEPEDLEETERPVANLATIAADPSALNLEAAFLEHLEQFQYRPIHITIGPSSSIHPRDPDRQSEAAYNEAFSSNASPFHSTTVWSMTDIFEERHNNILHHPIPRTN